ncbi:MAG: DNA adenine methylase [Endozoicomonas sp.]
MKNLKAPFPYFGGKSSAAPEIWRRFGKVNNYIEPFCGSLAVLLGRQEVQGYETVNDKSCFISNFWRAVKCDPEQVAEHCQFPVSETDLHARHSWLMFSEEMEAFRKNIADDPEFFDCKVAGWWCWGMCIWIGAGWCGESGLTKEGRTALKIPLPKKKGLLQNRRPDLYKSRGIQNALKKQLPNIHGRRGIQKSDAHEWLSILCDRLLSVRICNGEWHRVCSSKCVTTSLGTTGIFLDPPYGEKTDRDMRLYAEESGTVADEVRVWCIDRGKNKKLRLALCGYDGEHEELEEHGWSVFSWKAHGGYSNRNAENKNRKRERIWFSPACIKDTQMEFSF